MLRSDSPVGRDGELGRWNKTEYGEIFGKE